MKKILVIIIFSALAIFSRLQSVNAAVITTTYMIPIETATNYNRGDTSFTSSSPSSPDLNYSWDFMFKQRSPLTTEFTYPFLVIGTRELLSNGKDTQKTLTTVNSIENQFGLISFNLKNAYNSSWGYI